MKRIKVKFRPYIEHMHLSMKYWFFLILLALLTTSMVSDKKMDNEVCQIDNNTFIAGEELVYAVYYNWNFVWLPAGEVRFSLKESETDYLVDITGKTYPSYNSFFEVDDYFHSKINKETLLPTEFVRIVHEGKYHKFDSLSFDQKGLTATSYVGKSRSKAKEKTMAMEQCMHDMVSILYHIRNIPFQELDKGSTLPIQVMFDKEVFPLTVAYMGIKKKKIKNIGKVPTIYLKPEVVAGEVFDKNSHMKIYASNDDNRIPLMIESPVSVGSVKAVLKDVKGLKHPFNIKIKK